MMESSSGNNDESSVLANAIESGDVDTIGRLLIQNPELVNSKDWTPPPLHCAILWNQPAAAILLLDHGADIEMLDPDRQTTPLRYAIMFCKTEMIPLLISRNANTGCIVDGGTTAIELARTAAAGEFEQYDDLPRPDEYLAVIACLESLGLE